MSEPKDLQQRDYLLNRLKKRDRHLAKLARRQGSDCYRVYDRDIPEIPLVVDRYGSAALLVLYERPYEKPEAAERAWLELMRQAVAEALSVDYQSIYVKTRRRLGLEDQYERQAVERADKRQVMEQGLRFLVNLNEYLDTGLFMDHRNLRQQLRTEAAGKRVLNLFCYTGSFSVYALAGQAALVSGVDLSNTYLDWAIENIRLNGLPLSAYRSIRADVQAFLRSAAQEGQEYDLIIADPPTFSNSKKMDGFFDVNRHWPDLLAACGRVLAADGTLYFSSNSRELRFKPELIPDWQTEEISGRTVPEDFRAGIHRCWRLRRP